MPSENSISRRDFLKLTGATIGGLFLAPKVSALERFFRLGEANKEALSGTELEQTIPATKVPVLGYRYPGFSEAGVEITKDMFLSQMDFLKEGGFETLTQDELSAFLDNRVAVPVKSVALRIDQGAANFPEFEAMIDELKKRGFKATVVLDTARGQFTQQMQDKLASMIRDGVISNGKKEIFDRAGNAVNPFVASKTLENIAENERNNPRSFPLVVGGLSFDELLFAAMTPVDVKTIEKITKSSYPEYKFCEPEYLPVSPEQSEHLTKPEGIIIHTTDQSGTDWANWEPDSVGGSLETRKIDTSFSVGRSRSKQYLRMYKDVATPTRGAIGFRSYISIEMCGRDFNDVLDPATDPGKRQAIEEITRNTIKLVTRLMDTYKIGLETILGHYAASAAGKADPGQRYMENYFLPLLLSAVQTRHGNFTLGEDRKKK